MWLPRVAVGVFVGANLAVAGAIFQAITRNELASPYVLGVSSGAGFAVVLTIVFSLGTYLLPLAAAVGGTGAFLLVYAVAWRGGTTPVRLVLAGVDHIRDTPVSELSGGQKQLAFVAMALAQDTDVLLLDEPTTYLDLHHQLRVMEVVRTLNEDRDVTVCVVLHDLQQAARFADYLVALDDGEVYDWGPPADVVTESLLADVFGADAAVTYDDEPRIVPRRTLD